MVLSASGPHNQAVETVGVEGSPCFGEEPNHKGESSPFVGLSRGMIPGNFGRSRHGKISHKEKPRQLAGAFPMRFPFPGRFGRRGGHR